MKRLTLLKQKSRECSDIYVLAVQVRVSVSKLLSAGRQLDLASTFS